MSKDSAVIASAERAYDLSVPNDSWLAEVVQQLQPALDKGLGILGWLYDARDFKNLVFSSPVFIGIPEGLPAALVQCSADPRTPVWLTQLHYRTPAGPFSASLGKHFAGYLPWREHVHPLGVRDLIVVNGLDSNRRGCAISAPRRAIARISAERLALLQYLSAHLATAYRLRRRLDALPTAQPGAAHPHVEAVLSSSGKIAHAAAHARDRESQRALSRAVLAAERARGQLRRMNPCEALKTWQALVSGRWSLIDHCESDGRRYILAYVNTPAAPAVRSLSPLERRVLSSAALGKANKLIGYEFDLAPSTVATILKRAAEKLGATKPREVLALMDRLLTSPPAKAP